MNQEKIGRFIADLRREKGLTQAQLAERLHVNNRTVSRWETGRNMPDYAVLEDLTRELGVTVNELICGEKIVREEIMREYDHNLVEVLKEYKRMKRTKNILICLSLILAGVTAWLVMMFIVVIGLPYLIDQSAQIEVNEDIAFYQEYLGDGARREYRDKCGMDESIFPQEITGDMHVEDYKMVYYNPWDPQYLSYLVVDYGEEAWRAETKRLKNYPSTEYEGYYGVSGFHSYELCAICADSSYGFVYSLADCDRQRVVYVEIIFCNYYMDIDYEAYIPAEYLPDGFDASRENAYQQEKKTSRGRL